MSHGLRVNDILKVNDTKNNQYIQYSVEYVFSNDIADQHFTHNYNKLVSNKAFDLFCMKKGTIYNITFIKSLSIHFNTLQILTVQFLQLYKIKLFEGVFTQLSSCYFQMSSPSCAKRIDKKRNGLKLCTVTNHVFSYSHSLHKKRKK